MKFASSVAVAFLAVASASLLRGKDTPEEQRLDKDFRAEDSFGNTALTPACAKVECGEYSCPAPFELKKDATCCGYCWAPDHVVAADRHVVTAFNATGNVIDQCEEAPSTCKGPGANVVRCFRPSCREGDVPNCSPGSCCPICTTR
mmetsp:Transcript_101842/g.273443  ORF Transcript_101842/g.273443 Transcript_101842/m.273443 type:complete len:146 (-) Transcript_101842:146-583(-)